jgi:HJR/Mrr/RecB family endonuclease
MAIPQQRTHRITTARRPRRNRLARMHWGWWVFATLVAIGGLQSHPLVTIPVLALIAASLIVAAVRPRRFSRLFRRLDRIAARIPRPPSTPRQASLGRLQTMPWSDFERFVIARSQQSDYVAHAVGTGRPGDRGCDGIVTLQNGARVLVQCKRYKNTKKINGEMVRATDGAMRQAGCDLATIVTTSTFTPEGKIAAAQLGVIPFDGATTANWLRGGRAPWEPAY